MFLRSFLLLLLSTLALPQQISPQMYQSLHWRSIGPYRAGRITSIVGVPTQPNVYYAGTPGGGVWKTSDAGQVWKPIFDTVPVSSIGAVAVADSDPDIIYVGTGEQTAGNGIYRSADAGVTWSNIGLHDIRTITSICVDPKNPDIIIVAAAGDIAPGIYKTTDRGKEWKKVLSKDANTSVQDLNMSLGDAKVLYASLQHRDPNTEPGPPVASPHHEQDSFIYKSTDEGSTWSQVRGQGLPTDPMGRVGVVAASGKKSRVVYALASQGVFRSNDSGDTWQKTTSDPRVVANQYFGRIFVDPSNADTIYVAQTSMYRSMDGGKTFAAVFGAPSGDDFHVIWINPAAPQYMALGVDQGAIISVDKGATWSSWYNQPNGQFYHVTTDDRFPYYVYAAQQDSGTAAVASRSDFGEITDRDWAPTGGFEFSYIAPDPLNTGLVYIGGWYGSILRFERSTAQVHQVFVRTAKYRTAGMAPLAFSPQDKHRLYIAAQFVLKSDDAGFSWQEVSPDLTQMELPPDASPADKKRNAEAVISAMALSPVTANNIWVGTNNGLIKNTRDANSWQDSTPSGLPPRSSVQSLEASPHDPSTAYAVVRGFRDLHPYIFRTRDFGRTWQRIVTGMAENFPAWVVREDPVRKGLLYAGTDNAIYISFDQGDHWQSLQLDLPTTPVRDIALHGDDLVIATFGRSLYILDDISPLRQLQPSFANETARLLVPQPAIRVRWDMNQDTPYPIETPAGQNPPDGAILNYFLKSPGPSDLKLAIFDAQHHLVREYSATPAPYDRSPANVPDYWFEQPVALSHHAGLNRFVWDLRYPPPPTLRYSYYGGTLDYIEYTFADHAIPGETPHEQPLGPLVVPGDYSVEFTVAGQTYKQPLKVIGDPRVHATQADLQTQLDVEKNISAQMATTYAAYQQLSALQSAMDERKKSLPPSPATPSSLETATAAPGSASVTPANVSSTPSATSPAATSATPAAAITADAKDSAANPVSAKVSSATPLVLADHPADPFTAFADQVKHLRDGDPKDLGFGPLNRELARLESMISSSDGRPASQLQDAVYLSCNNLSKRSGLLKQLAGKALTDANAFLQQHKLAPLPPMDANQVPSPPACTN